MIREFADRFKVKISTFVANILEMDALDFGFIKRNEANKNALLNKLIPTLVEVRKERRKQIETILRDEYNRSDSEKIYSAVNTVIDRVYFNDEELDYLTDYIWIRPAKNNYPTFDEIATSETLITAQEYSVYIRGLLNEYCMLPIYKREALTFDHELELFSNASETHQILYFINRLTHERHKVYAFNYFYGYWTGTQNYCIYYDIDEHVIRATKLCEIGNVYTIEKKFKPSEKLIDLLQEYYEDCDFDKEITVEDY